ncbi:hypothetical protein HDV04_004822 [Boothiomyces sp. JEL0838]|nr:hypothetical protein HDV04_004822 [Boothiomyces sp. JEL0838]
METQPLLAPVYVVRKRSNKFYYLLAIVATLLISSLVLFTHISIDTNLPTVAEFSKALATEQDSYKAMVVDYDGNGLYVESDISFADIKETQIHYDIRSNDPKCMDHLFLKETIANKTFTLYLETNYEHYNPPRIQVYITIHLPSYIKLDDFNSKGGLKWNGPTFPVHHFEAKSYSGSIKIDQLVSSELTAHASSGSVKLTKVSVDGQVNLKTSSGSITAREVSATNLIMHASSGSIHGTILELKDSAEVKASSGSVEFEGNLTNHEMDNMVKIITSSGNIRATVNNYKTIECQVSSGSIELEGTPLKEETLSTLKTSSGSIRGTFFGFEGDFDSTTASGSLRINGNVDYDVTKSHHKAGRVGNGSGSIKTSSGSGSTSLYFK